MRPSLSNNHRRQPPATHTPRIQPKTILPHIHPALPVMSINHRHLLALMLRIHDAIPQLLPGRAVAPLARHARLDINSAHVHDLEGVLVFEGNVRDEAGVDDGDVVQGADAADVQDHGAGTEPCDLGVREGAREFAEFVVAMGEGFFGEVVCGAVECFVWTEEGGRCRGERRGFDKGEEDFVFVVAADAGGAEVFCVVDYAGGVGACDI
jgi:hypothetical protein